MYHNIQGQTSDNLQYFVQKKKIQLIETMIQCPGNQTKQVIELEIEKNYSQPIHVKWKDTEIKKNNYNPLKKVIILINVFSG